MLTQNHNDRITRKCVAALLTSIEVFPTLLTRAEPDTAARIVADFILAHTAAPAPTEQSPADALASLLTAAQHVDDATLDRLEAQYP